MNNMAESIRILAGQLERLKELQKSEELHNTINEFPGIMKEVVYFIENWSGAYSVVWDGSTTESLVVANRILVVPHRDEAIELRKEVDGFRENYGTFDGRGPNRTRYGFCAYINCVNHLICGTSHHGEWREDYTDRCCKYPRWVVCDSWPALLTRHLYTRNCPCYTSWCWQSSRYVTYPFCLGSHVTHHLVPRKCENSLCKGAGRSVASHRGE